MDNLKLILYVIISIIIYLIVKKEEKSYANSKHEKCRNCGTIIDSDSLYCPYCNEEIKRICDGCGRLIDIEWRYCPFCENHERNIEMIKTQEAKK